MPVRPPVHRPHAASGKVYTPPEQQRGTAASRGYGSRWQRARLGFLGEHPLCVECAAEGVVCAATVVDHITPHRGDQELFWSRANWQPMCKSHHDRKTAGEDGGFGNRRRPGPGRGAGQKSGGAAF